MVYILKLEVRGFKSFKDKVSIEFDRGFNAITGQNGSGKSNIIDAIRFALGSNSPKSLRESSMRRLINEKSRTARVSITLSNEDGAIPVGSEQVTITREIEESGEQKYYLNGKRTTRNAVEEILESAGISADSFNIVPQGSVGALAEMSPNERMELLQEIIGIRSFDERKKEALERLKEADQELTVTFAKMDEKRDIMVKLEKEMNSLVRYQLIAGELESYRKSLLLQRLDEARSKREKIENEIKEAEKEAENISRELEELIKLSEDSEMMKRLLEENASLRSRLEYLGKELSFLEESEASYKEELMKGKKALEELVEISEKLEKDKEDIKAKIKDEESFISNLSSELEKIKNALASLNGEKAELQNKAKEELAYRERMEKALDRLVSTKVKYRELLSRAQSILSKEDERIKGLEELLKVHEGLKESISKFLEKPEISDSYEESIKRLRERRKSILTEVAKANEVLIKALGYYNAQKLAKSLEAENEDLLKELPLGYVGRLSDIVSAEEGYEEALKAAIEYLKDPLIFSSQTKDVMTILKGGSRNRVVFVDKIRHKKPCKGSLAEHLRFDDKYKALVENLFGKICVSYDPCCEVLVEKDGTLIHSDFYEVGKSNEKVQYNLAKAEKIREAIEKLSKVISERLDTINRISDEIIEIRQKAVEASKILSDKGLGEEIGKMLKNEENALSIIKDYYENLRLELKKAYDEVEKYQSVVSKIEDKINTIKDRLSKTSFFEKDVEAIEEKIKEAEKRLEEAENELSERERRVSSMRSSLASIEDKLEVTKRSREELEDRVKRFEEKLSEIEKRKKEILAEREDLENKLKGLEPKVSLLSENAGEKSINEKKEGLVRQLNAANRRIEKLRAEADRLSEEEKELEKAISEIKAEGYELFGDYENLIRELEEEKLSIEPSLNRMALTDYGEYYKSYKEASDRRNELEKDRDAIVKFIEDIDAQKRKAFLEAFAEINKNLNEVFKQIVDGEAWLELENQADPFQGGVFLIGKFGDKEPRESASLSGGEKAVLSISFLMALQSVYPAKFYIFDEIDANLDANRAERLGEFLKSWSSKAQIILISLKDTMISKADKVFGVYERDGVSRVVPLEMSKVRNEG